MHYDLTGRTGLGTQEQTGAKSGPKCEAKRAKRAARRLEKGVKLPIRQGGEGGPGGGGGWGTQASLLEATFRESRGYQFTLGSLTSTATETTNTSILGLWASEVIVQGQTRGFLFRRKLIVLATFVLPSATWSVQSMWACVQTQGLERCKKLTDASDQSKQELARTRCTSSSSSSPSSSSS